MEPMENVRGFLRNAMPPSLQEKKNVASLTKLFPSLRERALSCYNCNTVKQTLQKAHNARVCVFVFEYFWHHDVLLSSLLCIMAVSIPRK